jgi:poly(3-hydroxybutyrate) depolymerase
MRNAARTLYCLVITFFATAVHAQQVFKTTQPSTISYYEYVPQDYNSNSDKYPVMIFLHGIGERGPNTTNVATLQSSIYEVAKLGPPMYVKNGTQFPFILISPQLKDNYGSWPSSYVLEVINHVKTYLRIDERRIYLTGLSLGGGGTWVAAQDYPELFAAIAPVCGGYNSLSKACGIAEENIPVWAFHGDIDSTVPLSRSVNMVNAINACTPAPSPLAKMTIYPGVNHNAWSKAYKTDNSVHNPNLYQWITTFTNTTKNGTKVPIANAGADKNVAPGSATLSGSGTDADGSIASYSWKQLSGPNTSTLSNSNAASLTLSNLIAGSYTFHLTVTDNLGVTDSDYIKVNVSESYGNVLPIVNAGADKSITLPSNSTSITATATDSDGSISSYAWTKVSGGSTTLSGTTSSTLSCSGMVTGTYVFKVTVTDNAGGKKSDDVSVIVNPTPSNNIAPIAKAGSDKMIAFPTKAITIVGSATDSDGTIASYAWTKLSGPASSLNNITTPKLWAYNLVEGVYSFRLTVTDNNGASSSDDMILTVQGESAGTTLPNIAPVANAGTNKTITLPTHAITIIGSGIDDDGTIVSYSWIKLSGPTATMSNATTSKLFASNLVQGTYSFKLTVTDNNGGIASDDMTLVVAPEPVVIPNVLPNVTAGPDKTITLPTRAITIVGTASDEDGTIASYSWAKISGPAAPMDKETTSKLWAYNLTVGTYVFRLTVNDNSGASRYDEMKLIVKDASTSMTSFATEDVSVVEINSDEEKVLGELSMTQLEDATVVVFNDAGERIYAGNWSSTSQNEVMNHSGLYIYNVIRHGKRSESGKIYIR